VLRIGVPEAMSKSRPVLPTAGGKKELDFLRRQTVMLPGPAEHLRLTHRGQQPTPTQIADVSIIHRCKQISVSET